MIYTLYTDKIKPNKKPVQNQQNNSVVIFVTLSSFFANWQILSQPKSEILDFRKSGDYPAGKNLFKVRKITLEQRSVNVVLTLFC